MESTTTKTPVTLESKFKFYRGLSAVLAVVCVFLGIVLAGQMNMDSNAEPKPATAPSDDNTAAQGTGTEDPAGAGNEDTPDSSTSSQTNTASYQDSMAVWRDENDTMAIGAVDAPVVIVEWTDMRCPFCALFHRDTLPVIVDEYVNTGRVRVEVRDVAFFGEQSQDAAVAGRAAGKQGLFFDYVQAVYGAAPERGHHELPRDRLIEFAQSVGVPDLAQFEADLDDPDLHTAVQESMTTAQSYGVTAVPFFVIGEQVISGAQSADVFRQTLDEALASAQ